MQQRLNTLRERQSGLQMRNYENDYCLLQFHSAIEIYMVDSGEMEMWVNGAYRKLQAGEFAVSLSYDAHAYKTPLASRSSAIFIPAHICEDFIHLTRDKRLQSPFIADGQAYRQLKEYCRGLEQAEGNPIKQLGYVNLILGTVLEGTALQDKGAQANFDLASKILAFVQEQFREDISPATIAQHFGYHPSYIARYFKASCGIPLVQYLAAVRLRNAVMLMRERKYSISYCALESGFNSMRTFYRAFREEFSCSPKEYLQNLEQ